MRHIFYYTLLLTFSFAQFFDWEENGTPIRQGIHIEWQRTGDANADGSMIYAWSDCRNGVRDVIAQKVDVNGNNLWGDYGVVVVNASGRQEDPQLVSDGTGGAYIIWMDYRNETDAEGDIYAQHVLSEGSLEWGAEGVALTNQEGKQGAPNICSDGQDGAFVIWKDNATSAYGDIYATHLSSSGIIAEGAGTPIITYTSYRSSPSLNTGGSGDAVLVWSDDRNSDEDLYAQRISVGINTIDTDWGSGGKLVCGASGNQTSPRVAQYDGNETIITWEDDRNSYIDAYYQILNGDGNGILNGDGVSACSGTWDIIKPRVKAENSVAYIVWEDRRNGWTSDIYAQKINSSGSTVWGDGKEICISDDNQTEPRLTTDGSGGVFFVWEDERNSDDSGIDIYAQHVNSGGSITHDSNGELICDAENKQFNPLVRNDGSGQALIIWGDQRTGGSYGLFVQRLRTSGTSLTDNGKESFFGISTDAANEPYNHGAVNLGDDGAFIYWQDNRWGRSKIFGTLISSSFDGSGGDYFSNSFINGQQLSSLDSLQETPKAIPVGDKIFLSFKVEESPNENLYFQLLEIDDLSQVGDATAIADATTSKPGFEMTLGEDDYIYYAYSQANFITIEKLNESGIEQWSVSGVTNSTDAMDDVIMSVYPYPGDGCIIIYESAGQVEGIHIYALALDGSGQIRNGWPVSISDLSGDQLYESSAITSEGIIISFRDKTSGNYDVYGQHVLFNGNLDFGPSGKTISDGPNDQRSSSLAYDQILNKVLVCYEVPDGSYKDLHCNEINLSSSEVGSQVIISGHEDNQNNPFVYWSGHSFMIAWEDSRNNVALNSGVDIYFQEYNSGYLTLPYGAEQISLFAQKQERPIIVNYTENDYIILWEDYRSTGKEFCANLYGQSFQSLPCSSGEYDCGLGNVNCDHDTFGNDTFNVLDVVLLANCVLAGDCAILPFACTTDINGDQYNNVLDIVQLANCVLAQNCVGRVDDAVEAKLIMIDNIVSIESDGFIGGVQMTLQHGDDFSIQMTDRALFSDYLTSGNETRLLIITPDTDDLFSYSGDFYITEVIVANSLNEVPVDLPTAFSLTASYPNPFNPTTTMKLFMPVAGEMRVEVYNLLGQCVAILANGYMEEGKYDLTWDASNVSSGIYFVKAQADRFTATQKIILVK